MRPSREVLMAWRAGPEIPCLPVLSVVTAAGSLCQSGRGTGRPPVRAAGPVLLWGAVAFGLHRGFGTRDPACVTQEGSRGPPWGSAHHLP